MVLRGFALPLAADLLQAVAHIEAHAPFRHLVTPGGKAEAAFTQSAAPPVAYGVSIALGTMLALLFPEPNALFGLLLHRG